MCILQNALILILSTYLSKQGGEIEATLPVYTTITSLIVLLLCIIAIIKLKEITVLVITAAKIEPANILPIIMLHHGKAR